MDVNSTISKMFDDNFELLMKEEFQTKATNGVIVNGGIVYDGIIDTDMFNGIVFLLKEATVAGTNKFGEGWSLVEQASAEAIEQKDKKPEDWAWDTICYWVEAYENPKSTFKSAANAGGNLAKIGIVNIKKTAGEGTSERAPFSTILKSEEYCKFIIDELNCIRDLNLVICGGTYEFAKRLFKKLNINIVINELECGAEYFIVEDVIYLSFLYPSIRCGKEVSFAYAKDVFSELKEKYGYLK